MESSCHVCKGEKKSSCKACRAIFYCGKECAKKDWARHKKECKPLEKCYVCGEESKDRCGNCRL
jgi:hypothetical protein